jgi:hypothetical protein
MFILWNGKILRRKNNFLHLKSLNSSPPSLIFQRFLHLLSCHGSLQCPIHYCHHEDDPSVERGTSRQGCVMCARGINRLGEGLRCFIGGAGAPSVTMGGRPAKSPGRLTTVGGRLTPLDVGQLSPAWQSSPAAQDRGSHPICALSPDLMIRKEHHSVTPTCPSTGVLTLKKITIRRQLVVLSSSSDDDLPLPMHDDRVDLNPSGARICYTQELALMLDSPPPSRPPYIVSGQRVRPRYDKVLIKNHYLSQL